MNEFQLFVCGLTVDVYGTDDIQGTTVTLTEEEKKVLQEIVRRSMEK